VQPEVVENKITNEALHQPRQNIPTLFENL